MAQTVEMPELGESVTEGTVTQWLKSVGDKVEVDEPLLEVSTDKVDTEIPSPVSGVLLEILAEEDETVDVGAVIAKIGDANGADSDSADAGHADNAEAADASEEEAQTESEESADADAAAESGDAEDIAMPELGESVTEGTITQWLKSVGDKVEIDEPLLEVSTDKVDTEVPSPVAGTLLEILANEDDTVDVGEVIARVGSGAPKKPADKAEDEPVEKAEPEPKTEPAQEAKPEPKTEAKAEPASAVDNPNLPYVTPLVRKLADKHGIDLNSISGSGVGGRIRKQDVLAAAEGGVAADKDAAAAAGSVAGPRASTHGVDPEKAALRGTTQKVNRIREITAKKTLESLQTSAQLTQVHEVDMTRVAELRKAAKPAFKDKHGINLTYLPFFAKAVVEALVSQPNVNASYNAEAKEMTYHQDVNLGIAVDTPDGLLSPVIHNAQDMSLPELAKAIVDIAERARTKKLKPQDLTGATFTITNIGSEGALTDTPILVPPQAAMLGTGAIVARPVVLNEDGADAIAIRQVALLPLTYDHQIIDGADAGRFVSNIKDRLETADFEEDLEL